MSPSSVSRPESPSRPVSPHHRDVFGELPMLLVRELRTAPVGALLDRLVAAGWRSGQLRHRVGAETSLGSVERDAAHLTDLLERLTTVLCPDAAHAQQVSDRALDRAAAVRDAPRPASSDVREQRLGEIRTQLSGLPRRRSDSPPRPRATCSLCGGPGSFFVTHEVHLCDCCVTALATGEVRLTRAG